jgi:hypothetical protein
MSNLTPESTLKDEVRKFLDKAGYFYRRMHSGSVRVKRGVVYLGPEGTADYLVCMQAGWNCWIELKDPDGRTAKARREAQDAFRQTVEALGHLYKRCESLDEVIEFLRFQKLQEVQCPK